MRRWTAILVAALVLVGCSGGDDDVPAPAALPDGWQEHEFGGGTVATPGDWTEVAPIDGDELTLEGPSPDEGLHAIARIRTTERDAVFDSLQQLFAAQLMLQFGEVVPGEDNDFELELAGAERAQVGTHRYVAPIDGEEIEIEERFVVAWFGGDRQAQMRIAAPVDRIDEEIETIRQIIELFRFDT